MDAPKNLKKRLKEELGKHSNLESLMYELMPEKYNQMIQKEVVMGIINEDHEVAIYQDGEDEILQRINRHNAIIRSREEQSLI